MNYISETTFWVVVVIMATTLGLVWYKLKSEIEKNTNSTQKLAGATKSVLSLGANSDRKIYYALGILYEAVGILEKHADKKAKDEVDALMKKHEKELDEIINNIPPEM